MPSKSWPETPCSEKCADGRITGRTGSITMGVVFASFLISTLGLGLCLLTWTYRQWSAYKSDAVLIREAAENGARAGQAALDEILAGRPFPLILADGEYEALRAATLAGETDAVAAALGTGLPLTAAETAGGWEWSSETEFRSVRVADSESFFGAAFAATIEARGRLSRRPQNKRTALDLGLSLMAGRVPLSSFPFLLAGENGPENAAALLAEGRVVLAPPESGSASPLPAAAGLPLIPTDPEPLVAEALRIKIFSPDKLTVLQLRRALGLPLVDEPVPDGVYLAVSEAVPGGIFIQGDVDEMILAAGDGRQHLQVRLEEGLWRMIFSPAEDVLEMTGPDGIPSLGRAPLPVVLINGSVASLGGGLIEADGTLSLTDSPDAPSLLAGLSLTLVSAGEIVISTHLIQDGVRWKDGIPYLKDASTQLFIYASGRDLVTGARADGRIRVAAEAPAGLHLQASLTARDGVRLEGTRHEVTVSGGLQASGLETAGALLTIRPDDRLTSDLADGASSPRAAVPVLFISGREILQWTDR